ncbi:hypothetical protein BHE74_00030423 [Ensete ventricosum]|nr:hypothetical protein BHE74_00030423 [Ensete ventricosum]
MDCSLPVSIEGEKEKKKKNKKKKKKKKKKRRKRRKKKRRRRTYFLRTVLARTLSPLAGRPHDVTARGSLV